MMIVIKTFWIGLAAITGLFLGIFVMWASLRNKASKYAFGGAVNALMGRNEYADARYKKALEFDQENFDALYYMAQRHASEKEFSQAVSFYERCLRLKPENPNVLFKLGAVFYDMNHEGRAVELWKKFIQKSGNEKNKKITISLLDKLYRGEREVLSNKAFLDNFKWHEEGFGSSKKIEVFLIACAFELALLICITI